MPNYKLGKSVVNEIEAQVALICERRVAYAEDGFPLTAAEIQAIVVSPERLERLRWLQADGMTQLNRTRSFGLLITRAFPGVHRGAVLQLATPEPLFYDATAPSYFDPAPYIDPVNSKWQPSLILDNAVDYLGPRQAEALATWVNRVVRENRLRAMCKTLVTAMLEHHLPTTGHVLVRWPMLASLVQDKFWKDRFRSPPVRNGLYKWDTGANKPNDWIKLMPVAEVILLAGEMMAKHVPETGVTRGSVPAFEKWDGKRKSETGT